MDAALRAAIDRDDLDAVRALVHQNVHHATAQEAETGRCALHHAAATGKAEALGILLEYVLTHVGADRGGDTPLSLALRGGHGACADLLLRHRTHLWLDERNVFEALIAGGVDDAARAEQIYRLGHSLRRSSGPVRELKLAESAGLSGIAAVMRKRVDDHDRAVRAIAARRTDVLRDLLASGRVHPDDLDPAGRPLLGHAIDVRDAQAVDALMEAGAHHDLALDGGKSLTERAIDTLDLPFIRHWLARTRDELDRTGLPADAKRALRGNADAPDGLAASIGNRSLNASELSYALEAAAWRGKRACIDWLLARGARLRWLGPAVLCGDAALLERLHQDGAALENPGGDGLSCLHLLALAPGDVNAMAEPLLDWGIDLHAAPRRWGDAVRFAERMGQPPLAATLRRLSSRAAFRWQAEARRKGIERIAFYYDKADGLVFTPQRAELPFEVGGDYDGGYPTTAQRALEQVHGTRLWAHLTPAQQRIVERLADGEDLSLDEVLAVVPPRAVR